MQTLSVAEARQKSAIGREARIQGWVRTRRDSKGGFSFIELNDGSSQGNVQVVAPGELPNYESEILHLSAGCAIEVTGTLVQSQGKGQTVELGAQAGMEILRALGRLAG